MFARLVGESFVRNPRRKLLTAAALVLGMAVATATLTVALDACQICGTAGYRQEGQSVICRNCGAAIYIPSIGQSGGCNPISVKSRVEGGEVIVDLSALGDAASKIHS